MKLSLFLILLSSCLFCYYQYGDVTLFEQLEVGAPFAYEATQNLKEVANMTDSQLQDVWIYSQPDYRGISQTPKDMDLFMKADGLTTNFNQYYGGRQCLEYRQTLDTYIIFKNPRVSGDLNDQIKILFGLSNVGYVQQGNIFRLVK